MGILMTSGDTLNLPYTKIKSTTKKMEQNKIQCLCPK